MRKRTGNDSTSDAVRSMSLSNIDLARTVGHELKIPLVYMANAASMLSDGDYSEAEKADQYKNLESNAKRMLQIIDSVLYAGQVETSQTTLKLEPTNVASIVHLVLIDTDALAKKYGKRVTLRATQELAPAAIDPVAFRHSIYGLIDMLIRTSEGRSIEILVHHQTDSVMVTIRDQGKSLSMAQIKNALSRMGQATQPLKQLPNTTGMAFYVAYSLSRAMGGDLSFKQGADKRTLSLKLPLSQQLELI